MNRGIIVRGAIVGLLILTFVFIKYEANEANNVRNKWLNQFELFEIAYTDGYENGIDNIAYNPITACEESFGYDSPKDIPVYSKFTADNAALYAAGYGYGYQNGVTENEEYSAAYYFAKMNKTYYNETFYSIYTFLKRFSSKR